MPNRLVKWLFIALITLIVFFLLLFVRITYVYDLNTKLPLNEAQVMITHGDFWNGCGDDNYYKTNFLGLIFEVGINNTCLTAVDKEGYIKNGKNRSSGFVNVVYLQKSSGSLLEYYTDPILASDGLDFLNALSKPLVYQETNTSTLMRIKPVVPNLASEGSVDLVIESIANTAAEKNVYGYGTAKIKFLGMGGIREINDELLSSGVYEPFAAWNLIAPPDVEYTKELVIGSYKQYVLRLRDGKTYVKAIPLITKDVNGNGYLTFRVITFNGSLLASSEKQAVGSTPIVQEEINIYPSDGQIASEEDIALSGRGFEPDSKITFYIEETNTEWSKNIGADGAWDTYFGEIVGEGSYNVSPSLSNIRTLVVSSNGKQQKFIFSIDKNLKFRQIYFLGLILNLPASLLVDSRSQNWIRLTDGNPANIYFMYSQEWPSYNDYLLSIRNDLIADSDLPPGIAKIATPGKGSAESYSFYDAQKKRSYELAEYDDSGLNLNIDYMLSLISNAQIQK